MVRSKWLVEQLGGWFLEKTFAIFWTTHILVLMQLHLVLTDISHRPTPSVCGCYLRASSEQTEIKRGLMKTRLQNRTFENFFEYKGSTDCGIGSLVKIFRLLSVSSSDHLEPSSNHHLSHRMAYNQLGSLSVGMHKT